MIAFAATFWLLRETSALVIPVACALLLALAVWPLVEPVRDHMPRHFKWLGATAGVLVVVAILAIFMVGIGLGAQQIYRLTTDLGPQLQDRFGALPLPDILSDGADPDTESLISNGVLASSAMTAFGMTTSTIGGIVLILFLMLLMLTEAGNWHQKITALGHRGDDRRWLEIGRSVGEKFRAYFVTRSIVGLLTALLYVAWLAAFGIEYLLLWGVLTVLLNFIPTVGSIISGMLPVFYALLTRDIASSAIIAGGLLVIEQVMGNFVDPKMMGRSLSMSPLVVLISLLFWSILWGIPGAFLAVPLTVLITMVMAHFDSLKPAALMLTDCSTLEDLDEYRQPK